MLGVALLLLYFQGGTMNGFPAYHSLDFRDHTDSRNLGNSRADIVGTLIHTTSGTDSLFWLTRGAAEAGQPASADYLIARDGSRYALCPAGKYPYHAGRGQIVYNSRLFKNDQVSQLLMGVELENRDDTWCTWQQLDSLAELVVLTGVVNRWRWPYYLLGHYESARPLGRRSDPCGFDWGAFMGHLYARANAFDVPGLRQGT